MKKLNYYQCDFCNEKDVKSRIEKHEKECGSDPLKKRCDSCKHFDTYMAHGLYFTEKCKKDVNCDLVGDIRYGEKACVMWEIK
jgi:hypothetical protein